MVQRHFLTIVCQMWWHAINDGRSYKLRSECHVSRMRPVLGCLGLHADSLSNFMRTLRNGGAATGVVDVGRLNSGPSQLFTTWYNWLLHIPG